MNITTALIQVVELAGDKFNLIKKRAI